MRLRHIPAALAVLVVGMAALAVAASPHFIRGATDVDTKGSDLVVSFKEAGLGSGARVTIMASVSAQIRYACVNNAGKLPPGRSAHATTTRLMGTGQFTADGKGVVSGSLTLASTDPPLPCASGLTPVVVSATYTRLRLSDLTSSTSLVLARTVTYRNDRAPRS